MRGPPGAGAVPSFGSGEPWAGGAWRAGGVIRPPPLTFVEAVRTCFQKYIDFTGRAKRSEYWYFVLFTVLGSAILTVVEDIVSRGETHFLAPLFSLCRAAAEPCGAGAPAA